jgi:serpin B
LYIVCTAIILSDREKDANYYVDGDESEMKIIENENSASYESDLCLYNGLVDKSQNFVFSPYSIRDCFSLLYDGVSGDSKNEMNEILGFSTRSTGYYRNYDKYISSDSGLHVGNKGFVQDVYKEELNTDILGTDSIDYFSMEDDPVQKINGYVADETKDKIVNLLPKESISEDTMLVLVNALYFNKSWSFDDDFIWWQDDKRYSAFSSEDYPIQNVKEANENIDVLRLVYDADKNSPLESHTYSMYIICDSSDSKTHNVDDFLENISSEEFENLLNFNDYAGLKDYDKVSCTVPNFTINCTDSISSKLSNLGLGSMFKKSDDFSKIGPLYINDVFHGAYINVNSTGTEAAAATAITMYELASRVETVEKIKYVQADSDFVFVLKDDTANNILFMGRVTQPTEEYGF